MVLVSESLWFFSQSCLLLSTICLKHTFQCLAASIFLTPNPHHSHLLFSKLGFYSTIILTFLNISGPLRGQSKSSSRDNRMVHRVRNTRHVFVYIEKQKIEKKNIIIHLVFFLFSFKLLKLHAMSFCNNKQSVLQLRSSHFYLCTLTTEQRGKGKYKSKCQGTVPYQDLITALGIFYI